MDFSKVMIEHIVEYKPQAIIYYRAKVGSDVEEIFNDAYNYMEYIDPYSFRNLGEISYTYSYLENIALWCFEITFNYQSSPQQDQFVEEKIQEIAAAIRKPNQTDLDILIEVHEYIITTYSYSLETKGSPYQVYTLFTEKQGVCQAYALIACKLLSCLGIASFFVPNTVEVDGHGWNLVQIAGKWYHVDFTWDDPNNYFGNFEIPSVNYQYFLKTDEQVLALHPFNTMYFPPAYCTKFQSFHSIKNSVRFESKIFFAHTEDRNTLYCLDYHKEPYTYEKVLNLSVSHLAIYKHKLFFRNNSDNGYFYVYNLQTKELKCSIRKRVDQLIVREGFLHMVLNGQSKQYRIKY